MTKAKYILFCVYCRKFNPHQAASKIEDWIAKGNVLAAKLGPDFSVLAVWREVNDTLQVANAKIQTTADWKRIKSLI